jgi:large subunit ribosomal protein L25
MSSSEANIKAEIRAEFGKGAARRIRRDNKIPAVVYGHGNEPVHLTLPGHQTMMALKHLGANAVLDIDIDGSSQLALTKAVQIDPIRRVIEHIDFVAVRQGEKVTVDVPILVHGDAAADTLVVVDHTTVQLEAEATHIPESIEVSIEGAEAGTQVLAGGLTLPKGSTLISDAELLIINVTAAQEADLGEVEGAAEGEVAEGEAAAAAEEAGETPAEGAASEE